MEKHFLEQYKTQDKPEAKKAAERKELRTGEKGIVSDRAERIQAYIERLENVFLNSDPKVRERNIELLKPTIYENTIIQEESFPESHFDLQKRILKNRGISDVEFNDEQKEQEITRVQESQRKSLDAWIDYLTGDDCKYPADLKYFAMQGVLRLGDFEDKREKYSFTKRLSSTVTPFAEIDREALSVVLGSLDAVHHDKPTDRYSQTILDLISRGNSFGDLYATTMYELDQKAGKKELLPMTDGEWKIFEKGSDAQMLADSLVGKRSNLCIRDIGSAESYLSQGVVEIYFSKDKDGNATVPRIAVAYAEDKNGVYEVRGTYNKNEDIDPFMEQTDILIDRLRELPNGEIFVKKDANMKKVTEIYNKCFKEDKKSGEKTYLSPELTKHDLAFLYEIDSKIEGFGYEDDPRIEELLEGRDKRSDLSLAIGCSPEEISLTEEEALSGGIKYHYGDLRLNRFTTTEGLTFPESIGGSLSLDGLTTAEGLTLPESIGKYLFLNGLTTAEGLILPKSIGGDLNLDSLTTAEGLILPKSIGGHLNLDSLTTAEGLIFPESIVDDLYLDSLTTAEGLTFPKSVGRDLNLKGLTTAEGLTLPESIGGYLSLNSLTTAEKNEVRNKYPQHKIHT